MRRISECAGHRGAEGYELDGDAMVFRTLIRLYDKGAFGDPYILPMVAGVLAFNYCKTTSYSATNSRGCLLEVWGGNVSL